MSAPDLAKLPVASWPKDFLATMQKLRKSDLWSRYKRLRAREDEIVAFFHEEGFPKMTAPVWRAIKKRIVRESVQGVMRGLKYG